MNIVNLNEFRKLNISNRITMLSRSKIVKDYPIYYLKLGMAKLSLQEDKINAADELVKMVETNLLCKGKPTFNQMINSILFLASRN